MKNKTLPLLADKIYNKEISINEIIELIALIHKFSKQLANQIILKETHLYNIPSESTAWLQASENYKNILKERLATTICQKKEMCESAAFSIEGIILAASRAVFFVNSDLFNEHFEKCFNYFAEMIKTEKYKHK